MLIASAGRTAAAAHTAFPAFSASVAPAGVMAAAARGGATRLPRLVIRQRRHSSSNKHSSRAKQQQPPVAAAAPEQGKAAGESTTAAPSTTTNKRGTRAAKKTGAQQQQQAAAKDKDTASKQDATAGTPSQAEHRQRGQQNSKAAEAGHEDAQVPFDAGINPPSVPPTAHFDHKVIYLARLFAQHRPISLSQPLPPQDGKAAFDSIFEPPSARKKTQDVMFTLASAVKSLESAATPNSNSVKVVTPSPFDEAADSFPQSPTINLEELQRSFRPFNAPPAPVPLDPKYMTQAQQQQLGMTQPPSSKRKKKAIAVPIAETTDSAVAVEAPVKETAAAAAAAAEMAEAELAAPKQMVLPSAQAVPTPAALFRGRMRLRYGSWLVSWIRRVRDRAMQLISVKRQRKLKMKKHKYKKLRKRTRNLRRRQDRL